MAMLIASCAFALITVAAVGAGICTALREWKDHCVNQAANGQYALGSKHAGDAVRSEAIRRGLAYYHPQTAEFTWNESKPKPEIVIPVAEKKAAKK